MTYGPDPCKRPPGMARAPRTGAWLVTHSTGEHVPMKFNASAKSKRAGAIAPLAALLIIPLVAMVAFAVDLGYIIQVRTDLQNTADAAALAGAQQSMEPYVHWVEPS